MPLVGKIVSEMLASADWRARRGACIIVALVAEGCSVTMLNNITGIVDSLFPLLNDPEYHVRYMVSLTSPVMLFIVFLCRASIGSVSVVARQTFFTEPQSMHRKVYPLE